jgi:hypothetical protein
MKIRQFFILFPAVFTIVAMLTSCHSRSNYPWPCKSQQAKAIATTWIKVQGDSRRGEMLVIEFNKKGECVQTYVGKNRTKTDCKGIELKKTFFCIPSPAGEPPDESHKANATIKIEGVAKEAYCGYVLELTDGADIHFSAYPEAENKKCKNVGGEVICY